VGLALQLSSYLQHSQERFVRLVRERGRLPKRIFMERSRWVSLESTDLGWDWTSDNVGSMGWPRPTGGAEPLPIFFSLFFFFFLIYIYINLLNF
jgi:hypothetical protein